MTDVCIATFSTSFHYYLTEQLTFEQTKVFCSETFSASTNPIIILLLTIIIILSFFPLILKGNKPLPFIGLDLAWVRKDPPDFLEFFRDAV